jgi:hypothetical protein
MAEGTWRPTRTERARDVILALGDSTLIIADRGGRALAHWSLSAIVRIGRRDRATFAPGDASAEELEVTDPAMIAALDAVRAAAARRRARPGSLRLALLAGLLVLAGALAALWLPEVLSRHVARVLPEATRAEIGASLLARIVRLTGPPCAESAGFPPLARLDARVREDGPGGLVLVPGGPREALHLPGGRILLRRTLVEDHEDPAVVAGFIVAEGARRAASDPIRALLEAAGPGAALRLLTSGRLSERTLAAEAERLVTADPAPLPPAVLLDAFAAADVPATPYARALDITGETTLALIEADAGAAAPVLADGDWVALQGACGD